MIYLKDNNIKVTSAEEVAKVFQEVFTREDTIEQNKEHFYIMHLDIRSTVKMVELVSVGGLTSSLVHPRETFRRAIIAGSAAIIIARNHPSGEPDPSDEGTQITRESGKQERFSSLIYSITSFLPKTRTGVLNSTGGEKRGSAYLVADETMNRVVEWLSWEVTTDPFLKRQLEEALGIDTTAYQWFVQLGQDRFALNIAGVEARYGEGAARSFRERTYHYTPAHGSEMQVLKSLQCWLYQCREGNVVKKPLSTFGMWLNPI